MKTNAFMLETFVSSLFVYFDRPVWLFSFTWSWRWKLPIDPQFVCQSLLVWQLTSQL